MKFLSIEMFKALTIEGKKDEYKNLCDFITNNFDDVCTEHYDLQRAYGLELKKGATSQKHKALNDVTKSYESKLLKAFRGHKVKNLLDKKKGETLKLIFEIDAHGNVCESTLIVKAPKREVKKAVVMMSNDSEKMKGNKAKGTFEFVK